MTGWFLASLHHVVFVGLIVMLATQMALLKIDPVPVQRIAKLDIGYGATAGLMVLVGIARVIWGEKGWAYYADNHLFWGKMGLFALIVIVFLVAQRKWLSAVLLPLGLAGGVALSEGLKAVFERERPPVAVQATAVVPSGETAMPGGMQARQSSGTTAGKAAAASAAPSAATISSSSSACV